MHSPEYVPESNGTLSRRTFLATMTAATALACENALSEEAKVEPIRFDGKTHIDVPAFTYLGHHPLTIDVVATPDRNDREMTLLGNLQRGGFGMQLREGKWEVVCSNGEQYVRSVSDKPAEAGKRVELLAVLDGRALRLYVDGVLQRDIVPWKGRYKQSNQPFFIGADPDGTGKPQHRFEGSLEHIRISSVTLDTLPKWKTIDRSKPVKQHLLFVTGMPEGEPLLDLSQNKLDCFLIRPER